MKILFSKCGFDCGHCVLYKENVKTKEARQRGSDSFKKYYNVRIRIDRFYCDGCQTPDEQNPVLIVPNCSIRKCTIINGVETCAECSEYPMCAHELKLFHPNVNREDIEARLGKSMPEEDYLVFVKPYQPYTYLEEIRSSLKPEDIKEARISVVKPRIVDFPDDLPMPKKEISTLKSLHQILAGIASMSAKTHAQQVEVKKRKEYMFKLLWTFGLYGELKKEKSTYLRIDSETYSAQKLTGQKRKVDLYLEVLKGNGVHCEYILEEEKWLTPMGWLRNKGWNMKMSFDKKTGGIAMLKALQTYTALLNEKCDKKGFSHFKKADMEVLKEK